MKNKGFSLVELIVVIAIMAILVGVAVPVYTGYISKANEAKDIQLLEEINSAFMTVAIENQVDFDDLTNTNNVIKVDRETGAIEFKLYANAEAGIDLNPGVKEILGDDLKFNVFANVTYYRNDRCFKAGTAVAYGENGGYIVLNKEDIENFKNSTFGTKLTVGEVLGKVNYVTGYASMITSNAFGKVLGSTEFASSAANALGVDVEDLPGEVSRLADDLLANPKLAELYPDIAAITDPDDRKAAAAKQVQTNAAVLFAAQNATNMKPANITETLTSGSAATGMLYNLNAGAPGTALSEAAVAYGMYVAYAHHNNMDASIYEDPKQVILQIDSDEDFQAYVKSAQGQADLQGFLSSMQMVNSSTGSKEAVDKLMVNGFADDDLVDIIEDAVGE